jgi:hypothetical protein
MPRDMEYNQASTQPCTLRFPISRSFWWLTAEGFFAKCECYIFPKSRSELKNDKKRRAISPKLRFHRSLLSDG